ncbi:hypothetical protein CYMTET_38366 [Cymbomonas tetramitiformis]|uniref:Uncharacterized protein n=1 Tax=Cymbomonas tetramitiformis TaxID=36881 RepID=A0AAE0CC50_9CHLO|nr:hypothetical protein CYMTET_38366 [Cymbomonas tetramitiformis]
MTRYTAAVLDGCLFESVAKRTTKMLMPTLFSMCMPRAAHIRSTSHVVCRHLLTVPPEQADRQKCVRFLQDVLLCGMRGGYSEARVKAATGHPLLSPSDAAQRANQRAGLACAVEKCLEKGTDDLTLVYCLREYIVHVVRDNPGLNTFMHAHVNGWSIFQCATMRTMDVARKRAHGAIANDAGDDAKGAFKAMCRAATKELRSMNRYSVRLPNVCDVDVSNLFTPRALRITMCSDKRARTYMCDASLYTDHPAAARAMSRMHATTRPFLIRLPRAYHDIYVDSVARASRFICQHAYDACAEMISLVYYCEVCRDVKNLTGKHYGMDKAVTSQGDAARHCASKRHVACKHLQLTHARLHDRGHSRSYALVYGQSVYMLTACCAKLVRDDWTKIAALHADSDPSQVTRCCTCEPSNGLDGHARGSPTKQASKAPVAPDAVSCAHCGCVQKVRTNRFYGMYLAAPGSTEPRLLHFCSQHRRGWMRAANASISNAVCMTTEDLLSYINMTSTRNTRTAPMEARKRLRSSV